MNVKRPTSMQLKSQNRSLDSIQRNVDAGWWTRSHNDGSLEIYMHKTVSGVKVRHFYHSPQ